MSAPGHAAAPGTAARGGALSVEQTGRRVQQVLDRLTDAGDEAARATAEELVRVLLDFYGAGLTRVVALLDARGALRPLLDDELVSALLVLHDLHPEEVTARIDRALGTVPEHLVVVAEFEAASGTLRLRPPAASGGCGCGGDGSAARQRIEEALSCYAPEVTAVEWAPAAPPGPTLLQIGSRPPTAHRVEAR
ncbi:hypothetical protein ACIGXM_11880 [Kitasatospora sp. NPDC052896]|uniref:hypothetical protein n=1 Tax=Kitasatospora sp. NPDC052896 TaxID=3364061 RepID=UPI0037C82A4E